jgi:hypothetical protein
LAHDVALAGLLVGEEKFVNALGLVGGLVFVGEQLGFVVADVEQCAVGSSRGEDVLFLVDDDVQPLSRSTGALCEMSAEDMDSDGVFFRRGGGGSERGKQQQGECCNAFHGASMDCTPIGAGAWALAVRRGKCICGYGDFGVAQDESNTIR